MVRAIDCFPEELPAPREQQEYAINVLEKAFRDYDTVILEGPVGSGKSAIAMTFARYFGHSHLLTPRKSLQNQYFHDFSSDVVMMKGRRAYPCFPMGTTHNGNLKYSSAIKEIEMGNTPRFTGRGCDSGPCLNNSDYRKECMEERKCPYIGAIHTALTNQHIVHNFHSFIFQASLNKVFDLRDLIVVDECHELEDVLKDLLTKKVVVRNKLLVSDRAELPESEDFQEWVNFFNRPEFLPADGSDQFKDYSDQVKALEESRMKNFVVEVKEDEFFRTTRFIFMPRNVGNAAEALILSLGRKRLLMSGTIYSKELFCRRLGLDPDNVFFLRLPTTFPAKNRQVIFKDKYLTDNSKRGWDTPGTFDKMVDNIRHVLNVFHDVRGLIHAPSYSASIEIAKALADERIVTHTADNAVSVIEDFFDSSASNAVLISPVCQQGVDFKYDRARFQIIVRVPYLNTGDSFIRDMVRNNFNLYNYKALVVFGQMLGRPVRAPDDVGTTVLLDSRFKKFISDHRSALGKDFFDALITR